MSTRNQRDVEFELTVTRIMFTGWRWLPVIQAGMVYSFFGNRFIWSVRWGYWRISAMGKFRPNEIANKAA